MHALHRHRHHDHSADFHLLYLQAKYILLDCDNTLVQSERLAFEACADLTNHLLEAKGRPERYTVDTLLESFVGHNFQGMLTKLKERHKLQLSDAEMDDYVQRELGVVTQKLSQKAVECPGVTQQLEWAKRQGYKMAVVSTSAKPRVVASLEKTNLLRFFPVEHVYSAATSLDPPSSKPDPAIYLYACEQLGVKPSEVFTVEDSKSGATAAQRAGIALIGYTGIYGIEDGREKMEEMDRLLTEVTGAKVIMEDWKDFPAAVKKVEEGLS